MTIRQRPLAISLSGNLLPFIINSAGLVQFSLYDGSEALLESSYEPDSKGLIEIDIKGLVESRLSYTIAGSAFYEQSSLVKTFTAKIDNTTVSFKVVRGGVFDLSDTPSNWLRNNFLTWQSQTKAVTYYSPEWLTYFATERCSVKLKAYFPDDSVQNVTLGTCESGKAFTANVQYAHVSGRLGHKYPSYYDVWVENGSGSRLSYVQRYVFSKVDSEQEQWFLFENSLGGLDTLRATGDTDLNSENEHRLAIVGEDIEEYKIDVKRIYTKNTGHLTAYERRWLLDFPGARVKYIYFQGAIRRIAVIESDFNFSASDLPTSYNFKYRFINQSALLNLVRNEEFIPENIVLPDISDPDFFLPPRLAEYPRASLHEGVILPAFDPLNDNPSVTTVGALIAAAVFEVLEKLAKGEGGGELVNVLRTTTSGEPSDYSVFSSLRSLQEMKKSIEKAIEELDLSDKFLSKVDNDIAEGLITFLKGLEVGNFTSGMLGSGGAFKMINGQSYLEVDKLTVRMIATFFELVISKIRHIGGQLILSPARMKCTKVDEKADGYKCYFNTGEDGETVNEFVVGDQARCQVFTGSKLKYYWRLVTEVGEDYIVLSKTDYDGDSIPEEGDDIVQLGNRTDIERMSAIILSTVGIDAPSIKQYNGINSYSLHGKELTVFSGKGNKISGKTVFIKDTTLDGVLEQIDEDIKNMEAGGNTTYFKKPKTYKKGDRWILLEDIVLNGIAYKKGQILEAVYTEGNDADWRLVMIEDEVKTNDGINLIRNYDLRYGLQFWGNHSAEDLDTKTGVLNEDLPEDFYERKTNVFGDEYGYRYGITTENNELIILDE